MLTDDFSMMRSTPTLCRRHGGADSVMVVMARSGDHHDDHAVKDQTWSWRTGSGTKYWNCSFERLAGDEDESLNSRTCLAVERVFCAAGNLQLFWFCSLLFKEQLHGELVLQKLLIHLTWARALTDRSNGHYSAKTPVA
jgi:hypothetical protein